MEIAGGEPIFPELRDKRLAKDRIVHAGRSAAPHARRHSRVVVRQENEEEHDRVARQDGTDLPAVQHDRIYDIPSTYILQPGPAALTEGVRLIYERLASMYPE